MKKFYRSTTDRKLSGVCGGLAQYLGVDTTLVRVVTVLAVLFTGIFPIVIAYLLMAILAPVRPDPARDVVSEQ